MPFETKPITFYSHLEVEDCPETKGIYAWYLYKQIVKIDGINIFLTLDELRKKGSLDPIELSSPLAFKKQWQGKLTFEDLEGEGFKAPKELSESEVELTIEKFKESFCGFFSPIYIGKADNLQTRISTHIRILRNLEEKIDLTEDDVEASEFARRAYKSNIRRNDLVFTFICFENKLPETDSLAIRNSLEFYLNHISSPRLGRK